MIALGDFNADGNYYSEGNGNDLAGFTYPQYITAIPNTADTTVATSSNTYDRMQLSSSMLEDFSAIWSVLRFGQMYDVTACEGTASTAGTENAVSDHYPVLAEFYLDRDTD